MRSATSRFTHNSTKNRPVKMIPSSNREASNSDQTEVKPSELNQR